MDMYVSETRFSATCRESQFQLERSVSVTSLGALRCVSIAARTLQCCVKVLSDEVRNEMVTAGGVVQRRRRGRSLFIGQSESTDEIVVLMPGFRVKDSESSVYRERYLRSTAVWTN